MPIDPYPCSTKQRQELVDIATHAAQLIQKPVTVTGCQVHQSLSSRCQTQPEDQQRKCKLALAES